jgi:hypothetical protein
MVLNKKLEADQAFDEKKGNDEKDAGDKKNGEKM